MAQNNLIVRLRLLLVGFHLLYGALQVALLFRFGDASLRQRLKRCWSRQVLDCSASGSSPIRMTGSASRAACWSATTYPSSTSSSSTPCSLRRSLPRAMLRRWPLIGWLSRHNDTVFIERGSRKAAHRTHRHMRQRSPPAGAWQSFRKAPRPPATSCCRSTPRCSRAPSTPPCRCMRSR